MKFDKLTTRILVRKDYGECFDFYTEKLGLVAVWGDRNGPYTSFAVTKESAPCFAIFAGENMSLFEGYRQPQESTQPDTIAAIIPSADFTDDYQRLSSLGIQFLGKPQFVEAWGMTCIYFRDTEGNLFELNDATSV